MEGGQLVAGGGAGGGGRGLCPDCATVRSSASLAFASRFFMNSVERRIFDRPSASAAFRMLTNSWARPGRAHSDGGCEAEGGEGRRGANWWRARR